MQLAIREARKMAGMSQKALAEKSGVSRQNIIRLESNGREDTTTGTLEKIASALGVRVTDILSD